MRNSERYRQPIRQVSSGLHWTKFACSWNQLGVCDGRGRLNWKDGTWKARAPKRWRAEKAHWTLTTLSPIYGFRAHLTPYPFPKWLIAPPRDLRTPAWNCCTVCKVTNGV